MSVIERIRDALSGATNREQSHSTEPADSAESVEPPAPAEPATPSASTAAEPAEPRDTRLYRCDSCGTTYVSTDLDACAQCSASVERIPTEQDLGLV